METGSILAERFRIEQMLGRGSFGAVWGAFDSVSKKHVAIKVLNETSRLDAQHRARFVREVRVLRSLGHPGIVQIIEVIDGDVLAFVMERLEGETLRDRLAAVECLDVRTAAGILAEVAGAVVSAHAAEVVHRDLKPDNVFLVGSGGELRAKVLDFGVAKSLRPPGVVGPSGVVTELGARIGTVAYMAPEQLIGAHDVDARADTWAIGVMLFELIAGCRPFEADSETELMRRILVDGVPPLESLRPGVPVEIDRLVAGCLQRTREHRPTLSVVESLLARYA